MAIKINFDPAGNPEPPTLVLARRNGNKLGQLNAKNIILKDCFNGIPELSFKVHKYLDGKKDSLWDDLKNFKLVYCKEWDLWLEATVETDETNETIKIVQCTRLGDAELSHIMLYDREINTEIDISRDDYELPTTLYNEERPDASLLHRIMDEVPHYSVIHVDYTIKDIQRTFTFDDISIYDAFQEISEEIGCLFVLHSNSDSSGKIQRTISVYDLETYCLDCGYRGEYSGSCPECGSTNIQNGYGEDTTIFITADELADEIQFSTDTGSTKNCFKLEAGDDLMTATIRNCNPNGTDKIWRIPSWQKEDMSDELVEKLDDYNSDCKYYQTEYNANLNENSLAQYNKLVDKYVQYNENIQKIESPVVGYSALMTAYYETVDFGLFLQSVLMPDVSMSDTNASEQAALLTASNLSPVAVSDVSKISLTTADSSVLAMAKAIVDSRYQVKINTSALENQTWTGNFVVTNYSDDEDVATSNSIAITLNDDYEVFVEQKIQKVLKKSEKDDLSIVGLFSLEYNEFCVELNKYCLDSLNIFLDACQACLDILIEQGIADDEAWADCDPNLYETLYLPYYEKFGAIEEEIAIRESEVEIICGEYDSNGGILTYGLQNYILHEKEYVQEQLDFQNYLGYDLWVEFCAYKREDKYSNSNYISDGLNNAELFERALEFIKIANKEIYKSSELQHSISSSLKNLLVIDKFKPLTQYFCVGNWIRVRIDDLVYKLRLLDYEIDYDNLSNINVDFSDVLKLADGVSDVKSILDKSASMGESYDSVKKQAEQGAQSNSMLNNWVEKSLDTTLVKLTNGSENQSYIADSHGMLFRQYDPLTDTFSPEQLKIINSMIAFTKDNWKTSQAAIGKFTYYDPADRLWKESYGVIADTIVGNIILSQNVGIYNPTGSISMDENGLVITTNGSDAIDTNAILVQKQITQDDGTTTLEKLFYIDEDGNLVLNGSVRIHSTSDGSDSTLEDSVSQVTMVNSDVYYCLSDSATELILNDEEVEWSTDSPTWVEGKYIWSKTVTTYSNGTTSESDPICVTGAKGDSGVGVASVAEEYAITDDKTTAPTEGWSEECPDWSVGLYLWTRTKIIYTDDAVEYTTPVCDTSWEAINGIEISGRNLIRNSETLLYEDYYFTHTHTNLVPISESCDAKDVYNSTGFQDNYALSEDSAPWEIENEGTFVTGFIPYDISGNKPIYVYGNFDTSNEFVGVMLYLSKDIRLTDSEEWLSVELISENYYKLTPNIEGKSSAYIRLSIVGTGENCIITIDEPIFATGLVEGIETISPLDIIEITSQINAVDTLGSYVFEDIIPLLEKEYTFSCWVRSDITEEDVEKSGQITIGDTIYATTSTWKRIELAFIPNQNDFKIVFDVNGLYYFYHSQLEQGNIPTAWKKAPEDTEDEFESVREEIRQAYTDITATSESIVLSALENYVTTDELGTYKEEMKSSLSVMSDEIKATVSRTEIIESENDELQDQYNTITKFMTFDINGLTIGQEENPYKQVFDNDRWSMYANDVEKMYIDGETGKLNIPEVNITEGLSLLGYSFTQDSDGVVNFEYIG